MRLNQGLKEARQKCIKGLRLFNIFGFIKKRPNCTKCNDFLLIFVIFTKQIANLAKMATSIQPQK